MSDLAFITDGSAAVVGLALALFNMATNHCPNDGCLAKNEVTPYTSVSVGEVVFQENGVGEEIYFRQRTSKAYGPFNFTYGASITDDGGFWIGAGSTGTYEFANDRLFVSFHSMPGIYVEGNEVDLGGPISFRSGVEFGYQSKSGVRASFGVDHRSNAGIYSDNPGLETVHFRVEIPTKQFFK